MNCNESHVQGCFVLPFYSHGEPVRGEAWRAVELSSDSSRPPRISWLCRARDTLQWTPEGLSLSGCKSCSPYGQLLMFHHERKGTYITNVPGQDLPCAIYCESVECSRKTEHSNFKELASQVYLKGAGLCVFVWQVLTLLNMTSKGQSLQQLDTL